MPSGTGEVTIFSYFFLNPSGTDRDPGLDLLFPYFWSLLRVCCMALSDSGSGFYLPSSERALHAARLTRWLVLKHLCLFTRINREYKDFCPNLSNNTFVFSLPGEGLGSSWLQIIISHANTRYFQLKGLEFKNVMNIQWHQFLLFLQNGWPLNSSRAKIGNIL